MFRALSLRYNSPKKVQQFLRSLPYNHEQNGESLSSALMSLKKKNAHCFEGAFIAAAICKELGYPPLVLSLDSRDCLGHVVFVFQSQGKWGAIGRSRDEGLHGRAPIFRSLRDLVWSYYEPYIDKSGRILGYKCVSLDELHPHWEAGTKNLWSAQEKLVSMKHKKLKSSLSRYKKLRRKYLNEGPPPKKPYWW